MGRCSSLVNPEPSNVRSEPDDSPWHAITPVTWWSFINANGEKWSLPWFTFRAATAEFQICDLVITSLAPDHRCKGKVNHASQESVGGDAHLPLPGLEPIGGEPLISVTRGQCDARPTVTFPAVRHHCPLAGTKLYCLVTEALVC